MYNMSKLVALRIPDELYEVLENQRNKLHLNLSEYILDSLKKQTRRLKKTTEIVKRTDQDIVDVISAFREINPVYIQWYGNKTQRGAIKRLLKGMGRDRVLHALEVVKEANETPYAPTITTPLELETRLAKLRAFYIKEHGKKELQTPKNFVI